MAGQVFAYIIHRGGQADETAMELIAAAERIGMGAPTAIVAGSGAELDAVCGQVAVSYQEVWKLDNPMLSYPNAEVVRNALLKVLPEGAILLVPHYTFGMDLSPGLSIKMDAAFVSDVVAIDGIEDGKLKIVRQEYGGQVSTHVGVDPSKGLVINIRPGAFVSTEVQVSGQVMVKSGEVGELTAKRTYLEVVEAEAGDVDITKEEVLVSIGRGIEEKENIEIARELANAMGAGLSCSRPIVDAKWLEKSRQVGTSGKTVMPKVYMAMGISGSFPHLGGLKGAPFIIAVNKNPKAPIFQVADVGIIADILEFMPALSKKIRDR
jgi:electron transfer flavoprotein alpha subunit